MSFEPRPNDSARQAKAAIPLLGVSFDGPSIAVLGVSVLLFTATVQMLMRLNYEWYIATPAGAIWIGLAWLYVKKYVIGKPTSYFTDLLNWTFWRLRNASYKSGAMDRPPELWSRTPAMRHPRDRSS